MYTIEISADTESEIDEIAKWYDKRVKGLSFKFYNDIDKRISDIIKHPTSFGFYNSKRGIRKCSFHNFPYKIFTRSTKAVFIL